MNTYEEIRIIPKLISDFCKNLLLDLHIPDSIVEYVNVAILIVVVSFLAWLLQYIVQRILNAFLLKAGEVTKNRIFKSFLDRKLGYYVAMIFPFILVKSSIPVIFFSFPALINPLFKIASFFLVFYFISIFLSLLSAASEHFKRNPSFKDQPIDSFIQLIKILLFSFGAIIIISMIANVKVKDLLTGLGAGSAILILVFKDAILGFVASIQVITNDMVRIGDWISMPKHMADGDVIKISLTTVKVRNFDKTIITIPTYSLISDSFQNWRGMQDIGSRRIKRAIFIRQATVKFITKGQFDYFKNIDGLSGFIEKMIGEITSYNEENEINTTLLLNGKQVTNLTLFRFYLEWYLENNKDINKDMLLMVRELAPSNNGLPLEIYVFAKGTNWVWYEHLMADIFDHIIASAKYFDLEILEKLSLNNIDVQNIVQENQTI